MLCFSIKRHYKFVEFTKAALGGYVKFSKKIQDMAAINIF
jgi:hypothetical protein